MGEWRGAGAHAIRCGVMAAGAALALLLCAAPGYAQTKHEPDCKTPAVLARLKDLSRTIKNYEKLETEAEDAFDKAEAAENAASQKWHEADAQAKASPTEANKAAEKSALHNFLETLPPAEHAQARLDDIKAKLSKYLNEWTKLDQLPPCTEQPAATPQPSKPTPPLGPSLRPARFDNIGFENFGAEVTGFGGGTAASSLGSDYSTSVMGARAAVSFKPTEFFRTQFDLEGKTSGNYCPTCYDASYLAGGGHLDATFAGSTNIGLTGGFAGYHPAFHAPTTTDGFGGLELKYTTGFGGGAYSLGAQAGLLNTMTGPGVQADAWYVEGRGQLALGQWFMGAGLGYSQGKAGSSTLDATSTQWSASVGYRVAGTPAIFSLNYLGINNRESMIGTVWTEHEFTAAFTFRFDSPAWTLSPMMPAPMALEAAYKF